ncbi:hypothetical protein WR25_03790 [Diploscapter pachys]|uniref:Uncharacterized protein n=1 Tax=Diploscapter pachys TaxID=2018661 RepID=A0A2A2LNM2_9BILA|nr:hypothetical protein WR25_03790 [Diploscapter pachys]
MASGRVAAAAQNGRAQGEVKHIHRRSSSRWVPPSGPINNPITAFRNRNDRVMGSRMIQPNHMFEVPRYELNNCRKFKNNSITTTKYSLLTFIPFNIFHQFATKYANLYFLLIAVINFIPSFGAFNPILALIPITFVLSTTMIKDGVEDLRRWRFDRQINSKTCHVWDRENGRFRKTDWQYILVGDFVHISNEQDVPADVLFLRSSDPNGICYVETSNLDGETSLKQRFVPKRYLDFSDENSGFEPSDFQDTIICESPDKAIYKIRAKIEYEPGIYDAVLSENMLLRGSRVKNTTFVEGVVMYAGHDTKIMMNNGRAPQKQSKIEKKTNKYIIICFVILVVMVVLGMFLSIFWVSDHEPTTAPYMPENTPTPAIDGLISDRPIDCRSLSIPEELGTVTHILSDKTGTLTENVMIFRCCSIDDADYGGEFDPLGTFDKGVYSLGNSEFYDITPEKFENMIEELNQSPPNGFTPLRLPNRDRVDTLHEMSFNPYEAESPDELALIYGAHLYDFRLEDRASGSVTLLLPNDQRKKYSILLKLPFDSRRKRMSVIIDTKRGPLLYTKGADSAIIDRLSPEMSDGETKRLQHIQSNIDKYASKGLRTLCFAMKQLTKEEFLEFEQSYKFLMDDASSEREQMLSEKADQIEFDLQILGVTGIEDRLQDGVPETIVSLRKAGIQIWILTGDKLETAQNIATASGLFNENRPIRVINGEDDMERAAEAEGCNLILSHNAIKAVEEGHPDSIRALEKAKSVLCYRMTPSEKATVVKSVKKYLTANVLAIGDGANDVPMIQAADVGIGVAGKEGLQAVMACDFAIARFRFLKKLLLVHGHWSYDRLSLAFLYFLYKNTPIFVGVLEQCETKEKLLENPDLYYIGREDRLYTTPRFFANIIDGIWQAGVVYFVTHLALLGSNAGLWDMGFYLATAMLFVNICHLALEVRYWHTYLILLNAVFVVFHFGYFFGFCYLAQPGWVKDIPTHVPLAALSHSSFYLTMIITVIVGLFPRFVSHVLANTLNDDRGKSLANSPLNGHKKQHRR